MPASNHTGCSLFSQDLVIVVIPVSVAVLTTSQPMPALDCSKDPVHGHIMEILYAPIRPFDG